MVEETQVPRGAVQRALEVQLFGRFTTRESIIAIGTDAGVLIKNNPERIGLVLVNTGLALITFGLKRDLLVNKGFILSQAGDTMTSNYIEDAQFPTHELSAIADGAGGELYVVEFIRSTL